MKIVVRFFSGVIVLLMLTQIIACGKASGVKTEASQDQQAATVQQAGDQTKGSDQNAPLAAKDPKDYNATVDIWTGDNIEYHQKVIDDFKKVYPNIKIAHHQVEHKDQLKKLQTAIASGLDLPDISWLEIGIRGSFVPTDIFEDLSQPPYNVDKSQLLDYLIPISINGKGELLGIEHDPAFAGLAYKRELCKKYFGTDDPNELSKMFDSWEMFIKKGEEVKKQSGGEVFMFGSPGEIFDVIKNQNANPYVVDSKLNLQESMGKAFKLVLEMKSKGLIDKLDTWSPAWNASFADSKHIFYPCATWTPTWVIKANDKNGEGRWGLMTPPEGAVFWGGTILGIPKKAKDKEAAFQYIQWAHLSKEGAVSKRDHMEFFTAIKSCYEDPNFYSLPDKFFGGQDVLKYFAQDIQESMLSSRPLCEYDQQISDAKELVMKSINASTTTTVEAAIKMMEDDITAKVPQLKR